MFNTQYFAWEKGAMVLLFILRFSGRSERPLTIFHIDWFVRSHSLLCICARLIQTWIRANYTSLLQEGDCIFTLNYESVRLKWGIILVLHNMNNACSTITHIPHVAEPECTVMLISIYYTFRNHSEYFIAKRNCDPKDIQRCWSYYYIQLLKLKLIAVLSPLSIWHGQLVRNSGSSRLFLLCW